MNSCFVFLLSRTVQVLKCNGRRCYITFPLSLVTESTRNSVRQITTTSQSRVISSGMPAATLLGSAVSVLG